MNRDVYPPSPRPSRSTRAIITALVALGMLVTAGAAPAIADPVYSVTAIPTNFTGAQTASGGVGNVRASWRNDGVDIGQVAVSAVAPPGQYFQRTGTATLYVLPQGSTSWAIDSQPDLAQQCTVDAAATGIVCPSLPVAWPQGTSLAVAFPTYVAPGTTVTGPVSVDSPTTMQLTVASLSVQSTEATAVASVDPVIPSSTFPVSGEREFTGAANPGTIVTIADSADAPLGTALTDTSGAWQLTLAPGYGVVHVLFETVDHVQTIGDSGYYNSYTFSVVTPLGGAAWFGSKTIAGLGQPQSAVVLSDHTGAVLAHTVADATGQWSLATPAALSVGAHQFVVTNTLSDGSTSTVQFDGTVVESPPLPAFTLAVSVSTRAVAADGEDVRVIRVVVTDSLGRPVVGRRVFFTAPAVLTLTARSGITDINGVASTTVAAPGETSARASASIDGLSAATAPIEFLAPRS